MSCEITCPYCFYRMWDSEVLFRSEKVNHGECDLLPDEYDDIDDFAVKYTGPDKEDILNAYRDWAFFAEGEDPVYQDFWAKFNGTTENNPADDILHVKAYRRRVIDPSIAAHRRYLKPQGPDNYFIYDDQGMVTQIELLTGEVCNRRVCPQCHNPLPDSYGKNTVKFASVIGITGAGKTVYLSPLLQRMKEYAVKVGLSAIVSNTGVRAFLENNRIAARAPLPGSTPSARLQQPLFYEMVRDAGQNQKVTETFVLYDVAGEVFREASLINQFAPFISHADGVIVLIDPMQFGAVSGATNVGIGLDHPVTVLDAVHDIITSGRAGEKSMVPLAVCISKADTQAVQQVFSPELRDMLRNDVRGIRDARGFNLPMFNASDYNPIFAQLYSFIQNNEMVLAQQLETNYANYAYFAFTALGCDVKNFKKIRDDEFEKIRRQRELQNEPPISQYVLTNDGSLPDEVFERTGQGELSTYQCPTGPVLPKRVEEPLLWLFHKLGYMSLDRYIEDPTRPKVVCPVCGSDNTEEGQYLMSSGFGPFKKKWYVNCCCHNCGNLWDKV